MTARVTERRAPVPFRDALVLVGLGGTVGTALRWVLGALTGGPVGLSGGVVAANVVGAFLLGWLVVRIERASWSSGRKERLRLFVGVGALGAFTTYSAFAVHSAQLLAEARFEAAFWQAALLVVVGLVAAGLGMAVGAKAGTDAAGDEGAQP